MNINNSKTSTQNPTNKKFILYLLFSCLITAFIFRMFLFIGIVPTQSMVPTIPVQSLVLSNRMAYNHAPILKGDIVVFYSKEEQKILVKRVIGTSGDTVAFQNNCVFINGHMLQEPYAVGETKGYNLKTVEVPSQSVLLLGDNRENSYDARKWKNPFTSTNMIIGKASCYLNFSQNSQHLFRFFA